MNNIIKNYNQLENKSIQFIIERLPHVNYFCTSASIPGITATAIRQPSPFTDVKVTGDKLIYQPLIVNFTIDEEMKNWQEIFDWMVDYAHPTEFEEYIDNNYTRNNLYSSKKSGATLLIPNNKYNTSHEFVFQDVFPMDISDVVFDVQVGDTQVAVCTATFEYTVYKKTR